MDFSLEQMVIANISLDIFAVILTFIPIVYLFSGRRYRQRLNLYFLGISVSNIFMILGDLADWTFQNPVEAWPKLLLNAGTSLFYVSSAFVLYFFARYITEYLKLEGNAKKICLYSVTAVCAVQIFFALLSPFTGSFFYVTDTGYQRGPLFFISQLVPLFCYLLFTTLVVVYYKRLKLREIVFFLLYIFVPLSGGAAQMFLRGIAVVNIGVSLALLFILVNIQFEHEVALREQEKRLAEQSIDIMLSQIQPHFLYNSLGAIYRLCETDPQKAKKATKSFSDFLRGNMDSLKAREPIPFEKELDHVRNYLYLEQQRFGEKLRVVYQIEANDFLIPPLTLQPLVENAVRHGVFHRSDGGQISISTVATDEYAVITIEDDGVGIEKSKEYPEFESHAHVGLVNVRSRIETMVNGRMEVESSDQGTTVTIQIPWGGGF